MIVAALVCAALAAQAPKDIPLPIAPSSPAFTLLGVEPAAVARPGALADFAFSVLSASNTFTAIPRDYALEIAPYWVIGARGARYSDYAKGGGGTQVIAETFGLSIATSRSATTTTDTNTTSLGIGFRFAVLRGAIDTAADGYGAKLDTLYDALRNIADKENRSFQERMERDPDIQRWRQQAADGDTTAARRIWARSQLHAVDAHIAVGRALRDTVDIATRIRGLAAGLHVRRTGWNVDAAGGVVLDFPSRAAKNGQLSRWGTWLNGGYTSRRITGLGVVRLLADTRDPSDNTLDVGGRLVYDPSPMFSLSTEMLVRLPANDSLDTQYRAAVITDISLRRNQAVQLSFGRDFDGNRSGSLIAAISLVLGFFWQPPLPSADR